MSADPLDHLSHFDRISFRAVLVNEGEDPGPALAEAGVTDPVSVPILFSEDHDSPGELFGDGVTRNLTAVLEMDQDEGFDISENQRERLSQRPAEVRRARPITAARPAAFGIRPLAPVRPRSR